MFSLKKTCCAAFLVLSLALPAHAADFSAKDLKSMSVFLSNFTELGFMDVDAAVFLDEKAPGDMIYVVKTVKPATEEDVEELRERKDAVKERRHKRVEKERERKKRQKKRSRDFSSGHSAKKPPGTF